MKMSKKAALEMSIGTIVTIVLMMSMLVLGLVLIKLIFTSATGVVKITDEQLKNEVNKLFSEDKKLVILPDTRRIDIKEGADPDGFGIGIKNLIEGSAGAKKFSYEVVVSSPNLNRDCQITESEAARYIVAGQAEDNIAIPPGDSTISRILFSVPVGTPLCKDIRYRINVKVDGQAYATDNFDITVKA